MVTRHRRSRPRAGPRSRRDTRPARSSPLAPPAIARLTAGSRHLGSVLAARTTARQIAASGVVVAILALSAGGAVLAGAALATWHTSAAATGVLIAGADARGVLGIRAPRRGRRGAGGCRGRRERGGPVSSPTAPPGAASNSTPCCCPSSRGRDSSLRSRPPASIRSQLAAALGRHRSASRSKPRRRASARPST